ncbi:hypothetical protein CABS03_06578 [Colletotrichum abscissum]|uniref:Uncharacterized protein n=1 Tax=Colletotrichum limetticola TaxID=1209924 RepID=A0ABQ9P954_9PEZI|nr:hypothetical protein CLIM01_14586 [Colletotrichum limetticola]
MEANATPFASADGLSFCNETVLKSAQIRPVLESFFDWFGLGLYRAFGTAPGDYTFRQSDPDSNVESLLVQLWSEGSKVTVWKGSHRHQLPSVRGENFLWRVPRAILKRLGLEPVEVTFERGGL